MFSELFRYVPFCTTFTVFSTWFMFVYVWSMCNEGCSVAGIVFSYMRRNILIEL